MPFRAKKKKQDCPSSLPGPQPRERVLKAPEPPEHLIGWAPTPPTPRFQHPSRLLQHRGGPANLASCNGMKGQLCQENKSFWYTGYSQLGGPPCIKAGPVQCLLLVLVGAHNCQKMSSKGNWITRNHSPDLDVGRWPERGTPPPGNKSEPTAF